MVLTSQKRAEQQWSAVEYRTRLTSNDPLLKMRNRLVKNLEPVHAFIPLSDK